MELSKLKNTDLFKLYTSILDELLIRKLIRTTNNPVADYAEYSVCKLLNLRISTNSFEGCDAVDNEGLRYQIKCRRNTTRNRSCQLGVIRNLDKKLFDILIGVIFNEDFSIQSIWQIPIEIVKEHSRFSSHQNGYILVLKGKILLHPQVKKISC